MTHELYPNDGKPIYWGNKTKPNQGVYVASVSCSAGWGGQGGTASLKLIEDPNQVLPRTVSGTTVEGHDIEGIGEGVYLCLDGLEIGGILQKFTFSESVGSGRTYDIVIESVSKLMDTVQVIIEKFNGMTDRYLSTGAFGNTFSTNLGSTTTGYGQNEDGINNVYNVFGHWENPIGGKFGGSNFNSAGIQIGVIVETLMRLSNNEFNKESDFGTGKYNGFAGPIVFGNTKYVLDLSQLAAAITSRNAYNYRISGPSKSLNALISEICDVLQFDFCYNVSPSSGFPDENGGDLITSLDDDEYAIIKVVCIDKGKPPNETAVKDFIAGAKATERLVSANNGIEYQNATTQRIIIGGSRTRYQAIPASMAIPIIGQTSGGWYETVNFSPTSSVVGSGPGITSSNPTATIRINVGNAEEGVSVPSLPDANKYNVSLMEIRMSLAGKESWEVFKCFETMSEQEPNGLNDPYECPWTAKVSPTAEFMNEIAGGTRFNARDLQESNGKKALKGFFKQKNKEADIIFKSVSDIANTYMMQQFLVPVVGEFSSYEQMAYVPPGDFEQIATWEIADAAFLQNRIVSDIKFCDGQGRQKSMVIYPYNSTFDYSNLGSDYAATSLLSGISGIASTKGGPDKEQFWYLNKFFTPYNTGSQVRVFDNITTPDFGMTVFAKYHFGIDLPPRTYIKQGKQGLQFAVPPDIAIPQQLCFAQESTRYQFGPWGTTGADLTGGAEVEFNESLRPETFGGWAELNVVGTVLANAGIIEAGSRSTELESGSVTIAGLPEQNLAERLMGQGPVITNINVSYETGGVTTSYTLNTYTPNFGKLAKYNIDRISRINKNIWAAQKKQRDRIEKRPLPKVKFEKTDFDMLGDGASARFNQQDAAAINATVQPGVLGGGQAENKGKQKRGNGNGQPGNPDF